MVFIPNVDQTSFADLAEPDSVDFDMIVQAHTNTYLQSGCVATVTGSNLTVTITGGTAVVNGVLTTVNGNTVPIGTQSGNPSQARIVLIVTDATGNFTALNNTANAGSGNPEIPAFSSGQVPLWLVYMNPGASVVTNSQLVDKRLLKPAHDQFAHTGDVIPNNTDQVFGTGSLNLQKRAAPATVAANTRTAFDYDYTTIVPASSGLAAVAVPKISVKDPAGAIIPLEAPLYGYADYIIFMDSSGVYARNVRTSVVDYALASGGSLHLIHNACAKNSGTAPATQQTSGVATGGTGDANLGCSIYLTTPNTALEEYTTDASLQMQMGETLVGPGRGFRIRPTATFPTGGPTAANAVIDAYTNTAASRIVGRVLITGLSINGKVNEADPTPKSGLIGILQRRPTSAESAGGGGDASKSTIYENEVYNVDGGGIWIGLPADSPGQSTANVWVHDNNVHDSTLNAKNFAVYIGDTELSDGNQSTTLFGYPLYISASSVHVIGASHYGVQSALNTNACIWINAGTSVRVVGAYLDNVNMPNTDPAHGPNDGKIGGIYTAGSRTQIRDCWFNGGAIATDLTTYCIVVDNAATCSITSNAGVGNNSNGGATTSAVRNFAAFIKTIGGPSAIRGMVVTDNAVDFCKNVWAGSNPPTLNKGNRVYYDATNIQANYNDLYSDNEGTDTFAGVTKAVTHFLDRTPAGVLLSGRAQGQGVLTYGTLGATTFTATAEFTNTAGFGWRAWT